MRQKRVVVLGSTGSVGRAALAALQDLQGRFAIVGLACHSDAAAEELLAVQALRHRPEAVATMRESGSDLLGTPLGRTRVFAGRRGVLGMLEATEPDVVVDAFGDTGGVEPSLAVLRAGGRLVPGDCESLVLAGALAVEAARETGAEILPASPGLSALVAVLGQGGTRAVREITLTTQAAAGRSLPVRNSALPGSRHAVSREAWRAARDATNRETMADKGLEVMAACALLGVQPRRIRVLAHPQGLVQALARTADGFVYCQLGGRDERSCIRAALMYPEMPALRGEVLDLASGSLSFTALEEGRLRLVNLAYEAAERGGAYPVAYCAANEAAVSLFLEDRIGLERIQELVDGTLQGDWSGALGTVEAVTEAHLKARERTAEIWKNTLRTA